MRRLWVIVPLLVLSSLWAGSARAQVAPFANSRAVTSDVGSVSDDRRSTFIGEVVESALPGSSAAAQTSFGLNRARAFSFDAGVDGALAQSEWLDVVGLGGSPLAPGGVIRADFRIDGSWSSFGEFELIAG